MMPSRGRKPKQCDYKIAEGIVVGATTKWGALLRRKMKKSRASSEGCIVKSMNFDSSTVELVDQPLAYRMSVRRAAIAWTEDAAPLRKLRYV